MTIDSHITKELAVMRRLEDEHSELTAMVVAEGFYNAYQSKHPVDKDNITSYYSRRADVFERYVRMEWKV